MHVVCPLIVFSLLLAALGDSQSLSKCNTSALGMGELHLLYIPT